MPSQPATATKAKESALEEEPAPAAPSGDGYVLPLVGVRLPSTLVNVGFWGGLAGVAVVGVVELPVAAVIGAGVLVARHQSNKSQSK
jgi:hypothetical protein